MPLAGVGDSIEEKRMNKAKGMKQEVCSWLVEKRRIKKEGKFHYEKSFCFKVWRFNAHRTLSF